MRRGTIVIFFALLGCLQLAAAAEAAQRPIVYSKVQWRWVGPEGERKQVEVGGIYAIGSGEVRQLTDHPQDVDPSVSREGSMIVFTRMGDLYAMRSDGSGLRQLTSGPEIDFEPEIAPNARYVLFNRRIWERSSHWEGESGEPPYTGDLHTVSLAGGSAQVLTRGPGREAEASFSPDGQAIVFLRGRATRASERQHVDVFSVPPTGGRATRLTNTWQDEAHPRFFARGIVFDRRRKAHEGVVGIFTMRRDGSDLRPLVIRRPEARVEAVSPNGRLLVFSVRSRGLWAKRLAGPAKQSRRAYRLTTPSEGPVFSPDSRRIAGIFGLPGGLSSLSSVDVRTGRSRGEGEVFNSVFPGQTLTYISYIAW